MSRLPLHQPPPPAVMALLVRAGISRSTAMAMETWKALEVLELLRLAGLADAPGEPALPTRGSI